MHINKLIFIYFLPYELIEKYDMKVSVHKFIMKSERLELFLKAIIY